jgi:hypothetical protein
VLQHAEVGQGKRKAGRIQVCWEHYQHRSHDMMQGRVVGYDPKIIGSREWATRGSGSSSVITMRQEEKVGKKRAARKAPQRLACRVGVGGVQAREGTQPMGMAEALEGGQGVGAGWARVRRRWCVLARPFSANGKARTRSRGNTRRRIDPSGLATTRNMALREVDERDGGKKQA